MSLSFDSKSFLLNGERFFMNSGEMHYFRIKKSKWKLHLEKFKEAGLNTVTTYIPWAWHEVTEGKFDFTGKTCPERDIEGFIKLCTKMGLYLSVKPGPYMLGEYVNQGLPEWLTNKYPEVVAKDAKGNAYPSYVLTYMHPVFLEKTFKWFSKIMPILEKNQSTRGGNVFFMQVCNEVGVNLWLFGEGDYSETSLSYYRQYLENHYGDIAKLNDLYSTQYKSFDEITDMPSGRKNTKEDFLRYRDWHDFHRWYYMVYIDLIIEEITKSNIDIQLYHNVPGWVYGRATDFPLNITMYRDLVKKHPNLVFGVDHIPESVGFTNFHDDAACNDMLMSMQGRKNPIFVAELQAGSREHSVRTYSNELEVFYKSCLAHDIKGWNYYMFSQGINPIGKGAFGPTFYWETVIENDATENELYPIVKRLSAWVDGNKEALLSSERKNDICVGWYKPYYQTEFVYPFPKRETYMDFAEAGINYDPKGIMNRVYFDGIVKVLKMINRQYDINDLEVMPLEELQKYRQLWVVSLEYMDKDTQKKLAQYAENGGTLIISPTIPSKDLDLKTCNVLANALKVKKNGILEMKEPKFDVYKHKDTFCTSRIELYKPAVKKEAIAFVEGNKCCGIEKKVGKGKVIALGTGIGYNVKEHLPLYDTLVKKGGSTQKVNVSNDYITVVPRYNEDGSMFVFVFNYHREDHLTDIEIKTSKVKGLILDLFVGATQCLILTFNKECPKNDAVIDYSTAEIVKVTEKANEITIKVFAYEGVDSLIGLRLPKKPKSVSLGGKKVSHTFKKGELIVDVLGTGNIDTLKIKL